MTPMIKINNPIHDTIGIKMVKCILPIKSTVCEAELYNPKLQYFVHGNDIKHLAVPA